MLAAETVSAEVKENLKAQFTQLDPVALLRHIDRLQDELWSYAYRERVTMIDLDEALTPTSLQGEGDRRLQPVRSQTVSAPLIQPVSGNYSAPDWRGAQIVSDRPQRLYRQQKNKYRGERWWRTRPDDFAEVWSEVVRQLERTPDLQARALFLILQRCYPGQFKDGQLRTFQRRVRQWRRQAVAQKLSVEHGY